jgi:hypothetical protein
MLTVLTVLTVFSALVLTPDHSRPCPGFTSERDLDAQRPEERLRPPQLTGEHPRITGATGESQRRWDEIEIPVEHRNSRCWRKKISGKPNWPRGWDWSDRMPLIRY